MVFLCVGTIGKAKTIETDRNQTITTTTATKQNNTAIKSKQYFSPFCYHCSHALNVFNTANKIHSQINQKQNQSVTDNKSN